MLNNGVNNDWLWKEFLKSYHYPELTFQAYVETIYFEQTDRMMLPNVIIEHVERLPNGNLIVHRDPSPVH